VTVLVPTAVIASVVPARVLSCAVSQGDGRHARGEDGATCREHASEAEGEDRSRRDGDHEAKEKEDVGSGSAREASSTSAGEHG
jgi:hypothetical protein